MTVLYTFYGYQNRFTHHSGGTGTAKKLIRIDLNFKHQSMP